MTRHALLVGCTRYPEVEAAFPERRIALEGPANDVELLAGTLVEVLGVSEQCMVRLVGWPDDEESRPTRANILKALRGLEQRVAEGDWVLLYFAGHGSQQRSSGGRGDDELDGLDEVFLPADVPPRADARGRVRGAITDDEIGQRVQALQELGAHVWLIVDCCHSGTMVRGDEAVVKRGLPSELFGVSREGARSLHRARSRGGSVDLERVVAMYGAQSYDEAPELPLPSGASDAVSHGLFTYLLCQELVRNGAGLTYGELHERIVAGYQALPCSITVPAIEGDRLRTIDLGESRSAPPLLAEVDGEGEITLSWGRLARIGEGTLVELVGAERAGGESHAALRVVEAGLFQSSARSTRDGVQIPPGVYPARVVEYPLDEMRLRVSLPELDEEALGLRTTVEQWRGGLRDELDGVELVAAPGEAHLVAERDGDGLWLRSTASEGGYDLGFVEPAQIGRVLRDRIKVRNLRRFVVDAVERGLGDALELVVERRRKQG